MTLMMRTWLAFTFAINRVAEGTCGESEKKKYYCCESEKKKTRNAVNITVVKVKVYDKYIEYYRCDNNSRGHSLVQIYPGGKGGYNLPLQHNSHRH